MVKQVVALHKYILFFMTPIFMFLASCDSYLGPDIEKAWQESFKEVLLDGYTNFKACYLDSDAAVYIFQYTPPVGMSTDEIFKSLSKQNARYKIITTTRDEMILRQENPIKGEQIFNEYRITINTKNKKVRIMFASIDSPLERSNYKFYLSKFYEEGEGETVTAD